LSASPSSTEWQYAYKSSRMASRSLLVMEE
jgi:hypothetical protein